MPRNTEQLRTLTGIACVPAYGRYYPDDGLMRQAWDDGADFEIVVTYPQIHAGRYINKEDYRKYAPQAIVSLRQPGRGKIIIGSVEGATWEVLLTPTPQARTRPGLKEGEVVGPYYSLEEAEGAAEDYRADGFNTKVRPVG